jgi:hypothetical protein
MTGELRVAMSSRLHSEQADDHFEEKLMQLLARPEASSTSIAAPRSVEALFFSESEQVQLLAAIVEAEERSCSTAVLWKGTNG